MPLNENQVRRIVSTFTHVDDLLKAVEAVTQPDPSPFARERPDVTPDEARLLLAFVSLARNRMAAALDRLGIPRPERTLSARWSVSTSLTFAEISVSELDPATLRGYGALDPADGQEVTALAADLQNLLRRGGALLREEQEGGVADLVAAVRGPAGEVLRRLLRTSAERGLVELRPLIAAAAERAGATTLDVGVFGRVSAGKSSLINALVREPILPVGATPVTAVPLRIGRGPHAVEVRFEKRGPLTVGLDELAAFATEESNPQNARGVRSIEVTAPHVPAGVRFLDTPGVGSLASTGSALAFAWLPRCDFGLVLVAAGTPLGRDETALISGLRHAGIPGCVLLSKSDLISDEDVERTRAYILRELAPLLGGDVIEIRAVSTRAGCSEGLERLMAEVLEPMAADHGRRATEVLRARLRRLVSLAAAGDGKGPVSPDTSIRFEKARVAAEARVDALTDELAGSARPLLAEVANAVGEAWKRGEDAAGVVRASIVSAAGRALADARRAVEEAGSHAGGEGATDSRRLPPLFDAPFLDAIKSIPPPRLAPGPVRRRIAGNAVAPLLPFLEEALSRYAARVRTWALGALKELRPETTGTVEERPLEGDLARLVALVERVDADLTPQR
jgi:GTP-binding protein EngB required for normal cell division